MSCVENNILLVGDGLSVAKETRPTVTDIGPHSGFDAVSARAIGQPGPVRRPSGSAYLTPSLSAESGVVGMVF